MTVGRAKWGCLGLVVCVVWSVGGVGLAAELSEAAQAKQYQRQATKALKAKDPQKAIWALKQLEKVTSERRWEFLYVYGTLLVEYGATAAERKKGHDLLVKAINKIEKMGKAEDPYYEPYYNAVLDRDSALKEKEEAAFGRAEAAGTAAAYAEYLAAYPQGRYAEAAEEKRNKRAAEEKKKAEEARRAEEEAAFGRAEAAGTAAAYAEYLAAYPQGRYAEAAEEKRNKRAAEEKKRAEEEAAFARADSAGTAAAYAEYLAAYPHGRYAEAAEEKKKVAEAARLRLKELLGEMVHVQGGTFRMGCTAEQEDDCADDEKPVHQVQVSDFEIGKYEVTQEVWEAVMGENPSYFEGCSQCPVEDVSWEDVQEFLDKLNDLTGEEYRLPTEAEWEYAAQGGQRQSILFWSERYKYAGSDEPDAVAWYDDNSGGEPHPVGQKRPNELGLYDMSGNVWEWTQDCWHDSYQGAPADGGAWERGDCSRRVRRGGSWGSRPRFLRSADRIRNTAGNRGSHLGFRLARTLTP